VICHCPPGTVFVFRIKTRFPTYRMTPAAYLGWMERKIVTEGHLLDHSKWPCRMKRWDGTKNNEGNRWRYAENKNDRRSDEEFFIIDEMANNDDTIRSKKLFLLYIRLDDPNGGSNKDVASVAWAPLAKVNNTPPPGLHERQFAIVSGLARYSCGNTCNDRSLAATSTPFVRLVSRNMGPGHPRSLQRLVEAVPESRLRRQPRRRDER